MAPCPLRERQLRNKPAQIGSLWKRAPRTQFAAKRVLQYALSPDSAAGTAHCESVNCAISPPKLAVCGSERSERSSQRSAYCNIRFLRTRLRALPAEKD